MDSPLLNKRSTCWLTRTPLFFVCLQKFVRISFDCWRIRGNKYNWLRDRYLFGKLFKQSSLLVLFFPHPTVNGKSGTKQKITYLYWVITSIREIWCGICWYRHNFHVLFWENSIFCLPILWSSCLLTCFFFTIFMTTLIFSDSQLVKSMDFTYCQLDILITESILVIVLPW